MIQIRRDKVINKILFCLIKVKMGKVILRKDIQALIAWIRGGMLSVESDRFVETPGIVLERI